MEDEYPPAMTRRLITLFVLVSSFMTQLDATIANVALPHMQASTSASREQITWVLTSYIIMAAMFTPLSGWLATRFGQKNVMVVSISGFTIASLLCGLAANFEQLIAFRLLQGMMGAALLPISQAILLDINPPERHGSAMAVWGMGAVLGPIIGPVLGGYLTDYLSWRWVFFINLPFGLIAAVGQMLYMRENRAERPMRLDLTGFFLLALSVGTFQLVLDRGQVLDWYQSREIWVETIVSATAFYLFIVHTLTARHPFVNLKLFRDSNYLLGNLFAFILGGLLYGTMALTPPLLAELMGYPIKLVGLVSAPRGIAMMIFMLIAGRLTGLIDSRWLIMSGLVLSAISMWILSGISLEMDSSLIVIAGIVHGIGAAIMFVPIATVVFKTIPAKYRNEASAVSSLIRNMSGAIWISVLHTMTIRNAATVQSHLVETVRPDNPVLELKLPDMDFGSADTIAGMAVEILRQALMASYANTFWMLFLACMLATPLVLLLRR
ncbi:MAG: DHA2 family efflux MFS transporter permease subunit [Novosphingobium sp.]|nr:DHA2 family efflux MFS transporter permease subunit [Novosphingobium sp.]MCP5402435.1 DHA2 family efflux MFS transporter permease subunit [Novosphingobium sp.]